MQSQIIDKKIAITGRLSESRDTIVERIIAGGGNFSSGVSQKTDLLVCNEPSESRKYREAKFRKIPIITENKLYDLIDGKISYEDIINEDEGRNRNRFKRMIIRIKR